MSPAGELLEEGHVPPGRLFAEIRDKLRRLVAAPDGIAVVAVPYEFGAHVAPHGDCFTPDAAEAATVFAAFHGSPAPHPTPAPLPTSPALALRAAWTRDQYARRVRRVREYLAAGDIYQANLTMSSTATFAGDARRAFAAGLARGGDRFAALLRIRDSWIVSFSPELFFRVRGRSIETCPIKGTRRRTGNAADDARLVAELHASAKECAEHVMIVDLERNDLGRICEFGSVRVDPLMRPTVHPRVIHLESSVRGDLRAGTTLDDVFAALFPGGSVTGTPKRRALQIITELEQSPRGIYCGALGWLDAAGNAEFNLPIRTAIARDDGRLVMQAGGGIVADSDEDSEWGELHAKLQFLRECFGCAEAPC